MRIRLHREAEREITEVSDYYGAISPRLRAGFGAELARAMDRLLQQPMAGAPVALRGALRRIVMARFPYSVFSRASGEEILVIAVAHHARRPDYWSGRER